MVKPLAKRVILVQSVDMPLTDNIAGAKQRIIQQMVATNVHCRPLRGCSTATAVQPPFARTSVRTAAPTTSGATPSSGRRYLQVWSHNNKFLSPRKKTVPVCGDGFLLRTKILPPTGENLCSRRRTNSPPQGEGTRRVRGVEKIINQKFPPR